MYSGRKVNVDKCCEPGYRSNLRVPAAPSCFKVDRTHRYRCVLCFRGGVFLAADAAAELCEDDDDEGGLRCVQDSGVLLQADVSARRPPLLSGRLQPRRLLRRVHPEPEHVERRCVTMETGGPTTTDRFMNEFCPAHLRVAALWLAQSAVCADV